MVIENIRGHIMEIATGEVYCFSCGEVIKAEAEICPKCGVRQKTNQLYQMKSRFLFKIRPEITPNMIF